MAIILYDDLTGEVELIAMGDDFDKYESLLTGDDPFLITGMVRIDKDEDRTRISVRIGRGRRRGPQRFSEDEPDVISLLKSKRNTCGRNPLTPMMPQSPAQQLLNLDKANHQEIPRLVTPRTSPTPAPATS